MKNALKFLSLFVVLGALIFTTSCGEDDGGGIIIGGGDEGSFKVADGLYIASISGSDTTVAVRNKLNDTNVEADAFGTQARSGHQSGYMYLEAGSHVFLEIDDQNAVQAYGGATSTYNDDETGNTDDYTGGYSVVDLSGSTTTFDVSNAGFYHVIFDQQTDEALIVEIASYGAIGGAVFSDACTSDGFSADVDMPKVSADASGAVFTGTNIILKGAEFKVRYNDSWKIDRRSDKSGFDPANGYVALCNLGGTLTSLEEGGANISLSDNSIADATYDITLTFDDAGSPSITLSSTGDAPTCAFDPANFDWGIIGAATLGSEGRDGWNDHKLLLYDQGASNGGKHVWKGVFPMKTGETFKFRTAGWTNRKSPGGENSPGEFTNNFETDRLTDVDDGSDRNWVLNTLPGGYIYAEISTSDQGETWDLIMDEAEWALIGDGSPVGNWNEGEGQAMTFSGDLSTGNTSVTGSGDFTTAGWKVFINQSFNYNLGGALDGTTALLFNNNTFELSAAGTYTITLSTADGGETYTATAQ